MNDIIHFSDLVSAAKETFGDRVIPAILSPGAQVRLDELLKKKFEQNDRRNKEMAG